MVRLRLRDKALPSDLCIGHLAEEDTVMLPRMKLTMDVEAESLGERGTFP